MWLYFIIAATAIWACTDVVNKILVTNYLKHPLNMLMITGLLSLPFAIAVSLYSGVGYVHSLGLIAILTGSLWAIAAVFYYKAINVEEPSRVIPLVFLKPIPVLILATIFLNEVFIPVKYLGIALVVIGAVLISIKKEKGILVETPALKFILVAVFFWASMDVLGRWVLYNLNYWQFLFHLFIGIFIVIALGFLIRKMRTTFLESYNKINITVASVLNGCMVLSAMILYSIGLSLGKASLVASANSAQALFVLLYATIASLFIPKLFKEDIRGVVLAVKLAAISCIIGGVYLIS